MALNLKNEESVVCDNHQKEHETPEEEMNCDAQEIDNDSHQQPANIAENAENQEKVRLTYDKQMSLPAENSKRRELVPKEMQEKINFIRQRKAASGQSAAGVSLGENPTNCSTPSSLLDDETRRKLAFIKQQKKISATNDVADKSDDNIKHDPNDPLDPETRRKLEFVRKNKKNSAPTSNNNDSISSASPASPPNLLRQQSNPEGGKLGGGRPSSFAEQYGDDSNLNDMLARIKTLREERKQILQDMNAIKTAFGGAANSQQADSANADKSDIADDGIETGESTPCNEINSPFKNGKNSPLPCPPSALSRRARRSFDSGIGTKSSIQGGSPTDELDAISENNSVLGTENPGRKKISKEEKEHADGVFYCFICGENLGKMSKGTVMHMGLEDGEPVCADALYLTDESKEKIMTIASTRMFSYEAKYELLDTMELETWDLEYDIPTGDIMDKVDAFLQDVEVQKQRDAEKFEAMRNGAIDEIFMEEFKELLSDRSGPEVSDTMNENKKANCDILVTRDSDDCQNNLNTSSTPPSAPPPPTPSRQPAMPPPPPPPQPTTTDNDQINIPKKSAPAFNNVLKSIRDGDHKKLKPTEVSSHSEIPVGQVIHKHIAPRVFTRDIRSLVKDISKDGHKQRLKKVKTNDKSAPFIPDDVEIYFYGGHNANKKLPPPPLSTKIKEEYNSCKKRANAVLDDSHVSPVYLAAQEGHLEVLQHLVRQSGGDLLARAGDGMAPLHAAAQMGCLDCLKWMVKDEGVDINLVDGDEATPLHFAASRGHTETVEWLLRHGASIKSDKYGKTPMNDAAENKQLEVLSTLMQHCNAEEARQWRKNNSEKSSEDPCSCDTNAGRNTSENEPFYLHPPGQPQEPTSRKHRENNKDGLEAVDGKTPVFCQGVAPPPPPLPPPDLLTPAPARRNLERKSSSDSMNSLNTLLSAEFSKHDNVQSEDGEVHVLRPSEIAKGKKRKNVKEENSENCDEDFVPLGPKPGAHMVLPFIPPKFPSLKGEGNALIKPSEYLKSLGSKSGHSSVEVDINELNERLFDDAASSSSSGGESGIDSPGSSLPSSSAGVSPPLPGQSPVSQLPVISEEASITGAPPPPPPPPAPGPPPPPPPPAAHPKLKATQSAPANVQNETSSNPQATMAISMKDLQSVHLKKTEGVSGSRGSKSDKPSQDPFKQMLQKSQKGFSSDTKGDLIAELKLSHTIGGISKLRNEQQKAAEEIEKEQYRKFLGQFTAENFLKKIPALDPLGNEIPKWKREMLAKKAADKAKQEALEERARLEEERKLQAIPAWKRQLMAQKDGEAAKRVAKLKKEREQERKKKLIMKL